MNKSEPVKRALDMIGLIHDKFINTAQSKHLADRIRNEDSFGMPTKFTPV